MAGGRLDGAQRGFDVTLVLQQWPEVSFRQEDAREAWGIAMAAESRIDINSVSPSFVL
jgi:hypothetical protein